MRIQEFTRRNGDNERGFTLIELLVVIIIIGILAAIAIPVFLNQRQKAYDASDKSDLRNVANFEEIYLNDYGSYGTIAQVEAAEPQVVISKSVTVTVVHYDGENGYCLSASHAGAPTVWFYDSQSGGLLPRGTTTCTTTGPAGGSLSG